MRLKLTLQSGGLPSGGLPSAGLPSSGLQLPSGDRRDLVVTLDSSTTVGELATYLVRTDPARPEGAGLRGRLGDGEGELTLMLVGQFHRVVDARSAYPLN